MVDLFLCQQDLQDDINAVTKWCSNLYDSTFSKYFSEVHSLYDRLECEDRPISNEELSYILIKLPLRLTEVAEKLNSLNVTRETVKMRNEYDRIISFNERRSLVGESIEDAKSAVNAELAERRLLVTAYNSVISRVEQEISFSRELIMGAKKIWDSRRDAISVNPVGLVDESDRKPEYTSKQTRSSKSANGIVQYSRDDILGRK